MNNNIDHKTLLNFSKGKYSYKDYLKVKNWFKRIEESKEIKEQLFAQWIELADAELAQDNSLNHIFEKIQYHILLEEKKEAKKINIWSFYRQVAAVFLIPVLALSIWYYISSKSANQTIESAESWIEINAPDGARVEFLLPDGSQGWLNSGSKLKYPPVFSEERKVKLSGEAWFNVKHLDNSGFVVSVPEMDVKVLGTQFNVTAYSEDASTDVILEEGNVEINGTVGVFNQVLSPNEKITFDHKSRSLKLCKVNASRFSAWKDGYLIIDNEQLRDVVARVERWYNVEIQIQDEVLKGYHFKATFKDEPLEEVLRLMAKTTPIIYKIEKRSEDSNGVLAKKKVTIKLKI